MVSLPTVRFASPSKGIVVMFSCGSLLFQCACSSRPFHISTTNRAPEARKPQRQNEFHLSNNSLCILCASAVKSRRSVKCQYCSAENPSMFEIVHRLVDLLEFVTARDEFIEF